MQRLQLAGLERPAQLQLGHAQWPTYAARAQLADHRRVQTIAQRALVEILPAAVQGELFALLRVTADAREKRRRPRVGLRRQAPHQLGGGQRRAGQQLVVAHCASAEHGRTVVRAAGHRREEMLQRRQRHFGAPRQALLPERVALVEQVDLGVLAALVEHLQATRFRVTQHQAEGVIDQHLAIQLQRDRLRRAQVGEQGGQIRQHPFAQLAVAPPPDAVLAGNTHQQTLIGLAQHLEGLRVQPLQTLGQGLRTVLGETLELHAVRRHALVQELAQTLEHRLRAFVAPVQHLVPAGQGEPVEAVHQIGFAAGVIQHIVAPTDQLGAGQALQWVDANVDQHQRPFDTALFQQQRIRHLGLRPGQRLQAGAQPLQLEVAQAALAGMQRHPAGAVQHAVALRPGQQGDQLAAALERHPVLALAGGQAAVVQRPLLGLQAPQGQVGLGEAGGDAGVHAVDLRRAAREQHAQTAAQHQHVALAERIEQLPLFGKALQALVAAQQRGDQQAQFAFHLAQLPARAAVEQAQPRLVPAPASA